MPVVSVFNFSVSTLTLLKGVYAIPRNKLIKGLIALPFALAALLYGSGYLSQFLYNYDVWQAAGETLYSGTSPQIPDPNFFTCLCAAFRFPYGLYGIGICLGLLGLLILMVMRMGYSDTGEYDIAASLLQRKSSSCRSAKHGAP